MAPPFLGAYRVPLASGNCIARRLSVVKNAGGSLMFSRSEPTAFGLWV